MTSHLLIATLRRFWKHKAYTLISLFSLSIGIACAAIVTRYVTFETGFDRFHQNGDRTYRVIVKLGSDNESNQSAQAPRPLLEAVRDQLPEVEHAALLEKSAQGVFRLNEKQFHEANLYMAQGEIFNILDLEWIKGDPAHALDDPRNIVITESFARRYFGDTDPMHHRMSFTYEAVQECIITGVIKTFPINRISVHLSFLRAPFFTLPAMTSVLAGILVQLHCMS